MVEDKIFYTCKKCGWQTSIRAEWSDLKPKRCMNKKCNTDFRVKKSDLVIEMPKKKRAASEKATKKTTKKTVKHDKKDKTDGQKEASSEAV